MKFKWIIKEAFNFFKRKTYNKNNQKYAFIQSWLFYSDVDYIQDEYGFDVINRNNEVYSIILDERHVIKYNNSTIIKIKQDESLDTIVNDLKLITEC